MKSPDLLHVEVTHLSTSNTRCSLGWMTPDGMQFHYWTTLETKRPARGEPLYKNCPVGLRTGQPGHFHARKLDPLAAHNAAMIKAAMHVADEMMLWTKAVAELNAKEEQRERDYQAARTVRRKHDAGPQLYDALVTALAALKRVKPQARGVLVVMDIEDAERKACDAIHAAETDNEANRTN
jgi:hypothetical protein